MESIVAGRICGFQSFSKTLGWAQPCEVALVALIRYCRDPSRQVRSVGFVFGLIIPTVDQIIVDQRLQDLVCCKSLTTCPRLGARSTP